MIFPLDPLTGDALSGYNPAFHPRCRIVRPEKIKRRVDALLQSGLTNEAMEIVSAVNAAQPGTFSVHFNNPLGD